jgi:hypothetical protein
LQRENSALCGLQHNRRHRPQAQVEKQKLSLAAALFPPAFGVMLRDARDIIQVIERTTHGRTNQQRPSISCTNSSVTVTVSSS